MISAIVDLGTNTFHILIFDNDRVIYKESLAAKMGMGGINRGEITPEGAERSIRVLKIFREKLDAYQVPDERVFAFGTSALRSAGNKEEVLARIREETGISVKVIDGAEEALLIYKGIRQAVAIEETAMIVDIGGGSVEFIICNPEKVLWMRSFEMGGQRLLERFKKKDPISQPEIHKMEQYFREELLPLTNAVHQYQPAVMIGSSGSFDTLNDMYYCKATGDFPPEDIAGFDYPAEEFGIAYEQLVFSTREERMRIAGMKELRVDMIVVAMVLIRFLLQAFGIKKIKISNYALKEGAMAQLSSGV
ncbi:phosphatase [Leadbetterella sp. DM7]|uniref:Ppx/GppA phosphatase family protein n=1 Tax=Leadbetterella sp. DM7 TaxID=3235085 RepID=UPI00349ED107